MVPFDSGECESDSQLKRHVEASWYLSKGTFRKTLLRLISRLDLMIMRGDQVFTPAASNARKIFLSCDPPI